MPRHAPFLLVLIAPLFFSPPASAQPEWWTLTDMTPEELRAIHEDRAETEKRYRRLVAEGKTEAPEDEAEYGRMAMVYLGSDTPELVPLWRAFDGFAGFFRLMPSWHDRAKDELLRYGVSEGGADAVIQYGVFLTDWIQAEIDAASPRIEKWMVALREAQRELGEDRYRQAVEARRASYLGSFGGLGEEESQDLMDLWLSNPVKDLKMARLVDLRQQLSEEDWNTFRGFLLVKIAPSTLLFLKENP